MTIARSLLLLVVLLSVGSGWAADGDPSTVPDVTYTTKAGVLVGDHTYIVHLYQVNAAQARQKLTEGNANLGLIPNAFFFAKNTSGTNWWFALRYAVGGRSVCARFPSGKNGMRDDEIVQSINDEKLPLIQEAVKQGSSYDNVSSSLDAKGLKLTKADWSIVETAFANWDEALPDILGTCEVMQLSDLIKNYVNDDNALEQSGQMNPPVVNAGSVVGGAEPGSEVANPEKQIDTLQAEIGVLTNERDSATSAEEELQKQHEDAKKSAETANAELAKMHSATTSESGARALLWIQWILLALMILLILLILLILVILSRVWSLRPLRQVESVTPEIFATAFADLKRHLEIRDRSIGRIDYPRYLSTYQEITKKISAYFFEKESSYNGFVQRIDGLARSDQRSSLQDIQELSSINKVSAHISNGQRESLTPNIEILRRCTGTSTQSMPTVADLDTFTDQLTATSNVAILLSHWLLWVDSYVLPSVSALTAKVLRLRHDIEELDGRLLRREREVGKLTDDYRRLTDRKDFYKQQSVQFSDFVREELVDAGAIASSMSQEGLGPEALADKAKEILAVRKQDVYLILYGRSLMALRKELVNAARNPQPYFEAVALHDLLDKLNQKQANSFSTLYESVDKREVLIGQWNQIIQRIYIAVLYLETYWPDRDETLQLLLGALRQAQATAATVLTRHGISPHRVTVPVPRSWFTANPWARPTDAAMASSQLAEAPEYRSRVEGLRREEDAFGEVSIWGFDAAGDVTKTELVKCRRLDWAEDR